MRQATASRLNARRLRYTLQRQTARRDNTSPKPTRSDEPHHAFAPRSDFTVTQRRDYTPPTLPRHFRTERHDNARQRHSRHRPCDEPRRERNCTERQRKASQARCDRARRDCTLTARRNPISPPQNIATTQRDSGLISATRQNGSGSEHCDNTSPHAITATTPDRSLPIYSVATFQSTS